MEIGFPLWDSQWWCKRDSTTVRSNGGWDLTRAIKWSVKRFYTPSTSLALRLETLSESLAMVRAFDGPRHIGESSLTTVLRFGDGPGQLCRKLRSSKSQNEKLLRLAVHLKRWDRNLKGFDVFRATWAFQDSCAWIEKSQKHWKSLRAGRALVQARLAMM